MNVYVTFDVEVWCNTWETLDEDFQACFDRYVYGRSSAGEFALPKTLAILNQHGVRGVFFVEPLFSVRFGSEYLKTIVQMIRDAGHDVQLHLHTEWVDEISVPGIATIVEKRQHLWMFSLAEQVSLIAFARQLLEAAGSGPVNAFRAGNFSGNTDTLEALRRVAIELDFSINRALHDPITQFGSYASPNAPIVLNGVCSLPVTIFKDGFNSLRHAQIGACSFGEMHDALLSAKELGCQNFVLFSHNFEMLRFESNQPEWVVVDRFTKICQFLESCHEQLPSVVAADAIGAVSGEGVHASTPRAGWFSTFVRYWQQAQRRLHRRNYPGLQYRQ